MPLSVELLLNIPQRRKIFPQGEKIIHQRRRKEKGEKVGQGSRKSSTGRQEGRKVDK